MDPTAIDAVTRFAQACGGGALHLEIRGPDRPKGLRRAFDQPFLVAGRSPDCDLVLDHEEVSWRHCYLQRLGGCLVCIDLDSQNGISIDGLSQRIGWIAPSQSLQIGPVTLRFLEEARTVDLAVAGPGSDTDTDSGSGVLRAAKRLHPFSAQYARDLPSAALEIEGVGGTPYGWRMSRALALVGRSSACQVRLLDDQVSKFHAALVRTPSGVWVVDLLSRAGVVVDGAAVRAARLDEGGTCQLGPFTLRHYRETFAPAPPRRSRPGGSLPARVERPRGGRVAGIAARGERAAHDPVLPSGWSVGSPGGGGGDGPDPYHQAVMTLAQMLGAMHDDHMNLVRDEMTQIRRLAEEMHALRAEISQRPAAPAAVPESPPALDPAPAPAPAFTPAPAPMASAPAAAPHPGDPLPFPPAARDPRECLAIATSFLASYEQKQNSHWSRILRLLSGARASGLGPDPTRGPLGQAPLG